MPGPRRPERSQAWAVGYEDRTAFAKAFKRVTGHSPAALRRSRLAVVQPPGMSLDQATG